MKVVSISENKTKFLIPVLFLMIATATEAMVLEGTVYCSESGQPLDSVRVVSLLQKRIGYTGTGGAFTLSVSQPPACRPDTVIMDEYDEYSVYGTGVTSPQRQRYEKNERVRITLFNLHGRPVAQAGGGYDFKQFTTGTTAGGIYLLSMTGRQPERLFVIDDAITGFIAKKRRRTVNVRYPTCPVTDTLYFFKKGYLHCTVPMDHVSGRLSVTLSKKRHVVSDFHNHTVLTDGDNILDTLLAHAFNEGNLDVYVNSEHGGAFSRDTAGVPIVNDPGQNLIAPRVQYGSIYVPRWYSLEQYSWPKLLGLRKKYPGKILLQGLEWNCPGHEHASVGFVHDGDQPDAVSIFEYRFDFNDPDASLPDYEKSNAYTHENALSALEWLRDNYPESSYFVVNHPSREAISPYTIAHIRDFHNTAPLISIGIEGMPGHQKSSVRGSYNFGATTRTRTWGGADVILAQVGGLWDALLGEGRRFWVFVNSDFHRVSNDFWPGEYAKTWSTVVDTGAMAWLEGLRRGEVFITHGDLVSDLSFYADDGFRITPMGGELHTEADTVTIIIRFKSAQVNNNGDVAKVDHVDLIAGTISGIIDKKDIEMYALPHNPSTEIITRFGEDCWKVEEDWYTMETAVPCRESMYFRLRGTNLPPGTVGETDEEGNPLVDTEYVNNEQVAWHDLWFYSNPVFVYR
jgi:hypothetical protein